MRVRRNFFIPLFLMCLIALPVAHARAEQVTATVSLIVASPGGFAQVDDAAIKNDRPPIESTDSSVIESIVMTDDGRGGPVQPARLLLVAY
jgi:hypothetical protein